MTRLSNPRRGVAAVELALLVLPFLAFFSVIAVDWARIFYYSAIVTHCARNGARYASDPDAQSSSPHANVTEAALADAPNLSPPPTVSSTTGADPSGPYVEVTVVWPFRTIVSFPGMRNTVLLHKVRMALNRQDPHLRGGK